jgi:hypothetical protein
MKNFRGLINQLAAARVHELLDRRVVFGALTRSLCITLALLLVITPVTPAQQPAQDFAPVPPQVTSAHTVFVSNGGGDNYFEYLVTGGVARAYSSFYSALQQSNQYQLVSAPAQADLIFEIRAIAPAVYDGQGITSYNPQLVLSILDPQTRTVLWTTSANVRAMGSLKRRDRGFDQSMAVLIDKLAQVTGQPLTAQQAKAVQDNSRWSNTGAIVLMVVGLATVAGMAAYGFHRVAHSPTLQQPTLPPGFGTIP